MNSICYWFLTLFFIVQLLFPISLVAQDKKPTEIVQEIGQYLDRAYMTYERGDPQEAKGLVSEAYFDVFEGEGLERAIGVRSPSKKADLEALFGRIIGMIGSRADPSRAKNTMDKLLKEMTIAARSLEKEVASSSPFSIFLNALIIILREGFEAILVISALAAYLVKIGRKDKVRTIYTGSFLALLASLLVALLFQVFLSAAGASREALEGLTMLFATAILFYVSYWLISKIQVARWQRYIRSKVEGSLSRGNVYALGFAAFLAVFREGAETVLFYQALYSSANGGLVYLLGGLGLGAVMLIGIFLAFRYGTVKIPLGPFFAVTSTLLYYLAFTFAGKGILELQGAGLISTTPAPWLPTLNILGIYPTWEGLSLQALLIIALLVAVVYSFLLKPYWEGEARLREISHITLDISQLHDSLDHIRQHARMCQKLYPDSEGAGGKEIHEMRGHLKEIDSKVHEVMEHLKRLEGELSDIFRELEGTVKKGR